MRKTILTLIGIFLLSGCSNNTFSNGTTFSSAGLDFSIDLPQGWMESQYTDYLTYKPNTIFGAVDIEFSNMPQPEGGYNVSNWPEGFQVVWLRVYDMNNNERHESNLSDYKEEFLPGLDAFESGKISEDVEVTTYPVGGGEYMTLYVYTTPDTWESHAEIKATAFYKGSDFAYEFGTSDADLDSGKMLIETVLKPMLSSFEDLSDN